MGVKTADYNSGKKVFFYCLFYCPPSRKIYFETINISFTIY